MKPYHPLNSNNSLNSFSSEISMDSYKVTPADSPTGQAFGGLPYHGKGLNIKNVDGSNKLPRKRRIAYCKLFNMADPADTKEYAGIMQKCADNIAHSTVKEILKTRQPLQIYLEWYEIICIDPVET